MRSTPSVREVVLDALTQLVGPVVAQPATCSSRRAPTLLTIARSLG